MIRALREADAPAFVDLRREALRAEPHAFAASPEDDAFASAEAVRAQLRQGPEAALFGAFDAERLVGTVGLYRDRHRKSAHKAHVWGVYVAPAHRGRGLAAALLAAALRHAATLPGVSWVHLVVSEAAPGAQRLYERLGFRVWGVEPEALRVGGRAFDDHHLALRLPPGPLTP